MYLQNADEELSTHMKDLIDWAIEFDYDIPCSLTDMEKYADEEIVKLAKNVKKDGDIDYYVKRATDLLTNLIKTYDELIESYKKQNSLPIDIVLKAIENTNKIADMIEPFELNREYKYPKLYEDGEQVLKQKIKELEENGNKKRK